ncbi:hypothetical protein DFA_06147 [Cavenderia fasciculata]|uniref:Uncharacterized protein n=1 Tax=Cavenderia fasciculata TaxID=261658 RepID=F4PK85_CACFS|nr:uncharacterized protein DFA_06147 [Cavenderia fasciculata]EGG24009.1 hypothetical protein DFA_06147 [Cavenderia fasciculata]|eukprot:XP_004361860.1 hypothetical protein DFA_06147 [Cavenderia fasciculata]
MSKRKDRDGEMIDVDAELIDVDEKGKREREKKKEGGGYNDEDLIRLAKDGWRCHLGDIKPTIQFDGIVRSTTLAKLGRDVKVPLKEAFSTLFSEQFWNLLLNEINKSIEKNKKVGGKEYSIYFDAQTFMAQDKYLVIEQAFSLSEESIHQLCQEMSINASELVKGFESGISHGKMKFEWDIVLEDQFVVDRITAFFHQLNGDYVREKEQKKVKKYKDDSKQVSLTGTHIRHWFPHLDNNKKKSADDDDNNNNVDDKDDDKLLKFMENKKMFVISKSKIQNRTTIDYMNDNGLKFIVKSSPRTFPDVYRILVDGAKDGNDQKVSAINANSNLLVIVESKVTDLEDFEQSDIKDSMYITNVYEPTFSGCNLRNPASSREIEYFNFDSFLKKINQFDATEKHMDDVNKFLYPLSVVADRNASLYTLASTKPHIEFIRDLKSFLFNSSKSDLYPNRPSTPTHTRTSTVNQKNCK